MKNIITQTSQVRNTVKTLSQESRQVFFNYVEQLKQKGGSLGEVPLLPYLEDHFFIKLSTGDSVVIQKEERKGLLGATLRIKVKQLVPVAKIKQVEKPQPVFQLPAEHLLRQLFNNFSNIGTTPDSESILRFITILSSLVATTLLLFTNKLQWDDLPTQLNRSPQSQVQCRNNLKK